MKLSIVQFFVLSLAWGILLVFASTSLRVLEKSPRSLTLEKENSSSEDPKFVQTEVKKFEYLMQKDIKLALEELAETYPQLVTFENSQERYGLPTAGGSTDCPFDDDVVGCKNYFITIEDKMSLDDRSAIPDVFLSGAVHGNERIGPTTVIETAKLLLEAAACEALPRPEGHISEQEKSNEVELAKECRRSLSARGIFPWIRRWLARLASTRRIVVIPSANAVGYFRNKREEERIDPNRDFAFDQINWSKCMQTIAARTINELFRDHIFQHSLTYHAGMVAIAYEWGAPSRNNPKGIPSPDDAAQIELGLGLSNYAGSFHPSKEGYKYPHDSMNDLVYPVHGGMEDWAYGGSWDTDLVKPCNPTTFGGYPESKTIYDNSTLRAFNFLIETSDNKNPLPTVLGTDEDLFGATAGEGNGHISRNVRLAMMMVDTVEPYISVLGAGEVVMPDDIIPLSSRSKKSCKSTHRVSVPNNLSSIEIIWTIGGAFTIDETKVAHGKWEDLPTLDCSTQTSSLDELLSGAIHSNPQSGKSRWSENPSPSQTNIWLSDKVGSEIPYGPIFTETINLENYSLGDTIAVIPYAVVDQDWSKQPENYTPKVPPQSHVVNARTNPDWRYENVGKVVQGRTHWISVPLTLEIVDGIDTPMVQNIRLDGSSDNDSNNDGASDPFEDPATLNDDHTENSGSKKTFLSAVISIPIILALLSYLIHKRRQQRKTRHMFEMTPVQEIDEIEPYSDDDRFEGEGISA